MERSLTIQCKNCFKLLRENVAAFSAFSKMQLISDRLHLVCKKWKFCGFFLILIVAKYKEIFTMD